MLFSFVLLKKHYIYRSQINVNYCKWEILIAETGKRSIQKK